MEEANTVGFETYVGYVFAKNWILNADIAYAMGKNQVTSEPLPQIAPLESNIEFGYKSKAYWATANVRLVGEQNDVSKSFGEVASPAFQLVDLNLGGVVMKHLTLGLSVTNLFDTAYYEHLNFRYKNSSTDKGFILESGRNISAFAKYKF